jgi:cytochrome c-type protein NapB
LLTVIVGCASYEPLVSMRGTEVNAPDKAPAPLKYMGSRPGTQPVVARTYAEQPPVIPHAVDNFDEVTLTENQCMDCHGPANYVKKNSPKLGDSHFVAATKAFDASRHVCTSCHVAQVDAPALVENRFIGNIK